ncbi:MAG TPA: hypothetical protein QF564_14375 [Pirellulaceae bacterium]|jgi:hypothetical protein|nr:hypothetical protein [Pirellulaceae bacterium]
MSVPNLPMHEGLLVRSRLRTAASPIDQTHVWELGWLMAMGFAAASAATFGDWSLGIPGHAILRIVFPMTLGLALVPRHGGGLVMGASALATTAVYKAVGHGIPGMGAMTSLAVFGPILDLVLLRGRRGWQLFGGFALAGLASNLTAFAVRSGSRLAGAGRSASGLVRGAGLGGGNGMGAVVGWVVAADLEAVAGSALVR